MNPRGASTLRNLGWWAGLNGCTGTATLTARTGYNLHNFSACTLGAEAVLVGQRVERHRLIVIPRVRGWLGGVVRCAARLQAASPCRRRRVAWRVAGAL